MLDLKRYGKCGILKANVGIKGEEQMLKCSGEKWIINYKEKLIRLCLSVLCVIVFLIQTSVFAYQETEINPFGLKISLSDDFVIYKDVNYIDKNYTDELENDDLYFCAASELKNMSIQVWKAGESEYETINNLSDNKILEIMKDVGFLEMAKNFMTESSMEISLQTYNGQKYYIISSFFKEAPDMFGQYVATINNGYIVWYQIFHYDTYSEENTKELLESFTVIEDEEFFSDEVKVKYVRKKVRNNVLAKGVIKCIVYAVIMVAFVFLKKIWDKLSNKKPQENEELIEKDIITNNSYQNNLCHECEKEIGLAKNEQKNTCKEYEVCIFDVETKTMRKEMREIDIIKFPSLKYAVNNTYYAIEKIRDGKKIRIYCEKNNWDKQIENSL